MKKLGIVITDGVGFRNFILSNFINEAFQKFDKIIIYSFIPKKFYGIVDKSVLIRELNPIDENKVTWFLRRLKEIAHLKNNYHKNFGIRDQFNQNRSTKILSRKILIEIIYFIIRFFYSEEFIIKVSKLQEKYLHSNNSRGLYYSMLNDDKVDLLFFSHQRPNFISPMVAVARECNILLSTFIFSWDNIPSKNRMASIFDYYFVWSDLMKSELLDFYSSINEDKVLVVGTPQFEIYSMNEYAISKDEFFKRFDLNPEKKTICYSCGDLTTSPNDPYYISLIAQAIVDNNIFEDVNLIIRTSPAESHERFSELENKFPFLKWNFPRWVLSNNDKIEQWTQRIPDVVDCIDLRSLVEHSDLNVNLCSTMGLDFMHFDKPVINPVIGNGLNELFNDQKYLKYAHYEKVVESGAVEVALTPSQLIALINNNLKDPFLKSLERKSLLKLHTGSSGSYISRNFVNKIHKISHK